MEEFTAAATALSERTTVPGYQYKFNGQEWQHELGLNLYDMDYRDYDPAIGRWTGIDPVTHHSMSPYNGFDNNPVFWADPSGADGHNFSFDGGVSYNTQSTGMAPDGREDENRDQAYEIFNIGWGAMDGDPPTKNTIYNLFAEVLKLAPGTEINIDEAIKKYKLDPEIKGAIKRVKLISKNAIYIDWNKEEKINQYSFINVRDGIIKIQRVSLPAGKGKYFNGYKITGGNLQVDNTSMWNDNGSIYNDVFLGPSGFVRGIIKETTTNTTLTNGYGL